MSAKRVLNVFRVWHFVLKSKGAIRSWSTIKKNRSNFTTFESHFKTQYRSSHFYNLNHEKFHAKHKLIKSNHLSSTSEHISGDDPLVSLDLVVSLNFLLLIFGPDYSAQGQHEEQEAPVSFHDVEEWICGFLDMWEGWGGDRSDRQRGTASVRPIYVVLYRGWWQAGGAEARHHPPPTRWPSLCVVRAGDVSAFGCGSVEKVDWLMRSVRWLEIWLECWVDWMRFLCWRWTVGEGWWWNWDV